MIEFQTHSLYGIESLTSQVKTWYHSFIVYVHVCTENDMLEYMVWNFVFFSFDFCLNQEEYAGSPTENLGQVVFGERIRPSMYIVSIVITNMMPGLKT